MAGIIIMETIMNIWNDLTSNYKVTRTNKSLINALIENPDKGLWSKYGFWIKYTAKKEGNVIIVSTEDVGRDGGCAGGTCYINTSNMNQCVWDL